MNRMCTVFDCNIIHFPVIQNRAGNITPVQNNIEVPFAVQRIYYLYDIPAGNDRGGHAHKNLQQLIIAASGSFDITIDDGKNKKTVHLSRPFLGLHVLPGIWRNLSNFSSGSICLVLASELYNPSDYIRDYQDYINYRNEK